ncbi:MAG: efflux RND transporter permease subunit [Armatimonadota bacterium]|jgi:HAE1 family hydrophobic/amphiphilic exporter-1
MWLTASAIRRPVLILMVISGLIVLGNIGRGRMPVDLYPKIDLPFLTVLTTYPGAGPEEIEELVTEPIEDAVGTVSNIKEVRSASQEGFCTVGVEFHYGTDLDVAAADLRDRIDVVQADLPDDAERPTLIKADIAALPVVTLAAFSDRPPQELRKLVDDVVKERLSGLPGVAAVGIAGGEEREIQVLVDKARLDALNLSILGLSQLLAAQNLNLPSGEIEEGRQEYSVRLMGQFESVDEIRNVTLATPLGTIRLREIAEVHDAVADREDISRVDRRDSVTITVQKQADANTVRVADAVRGMLPRVAEELPGDVELRVALDSSEFVRDALYDVQEALILGAILAALIVFLFLHNIRATVIVGLAIPTSIMATFLPISFFGFTLNMMVMLGLALCVGILVDDSIVVLENITRHLHLGEQPDVAAFNGRSEIGFAAIAITLVDVVVFIPVAFMGGIVGQFFFAFGITVAVATLFSLFMSFTLTPMMASKLFRRVEAAGAGGAGGLGGRGPARWGNAVAGRFSASFEAVYGMADRGYRRLLQWPVRSRFAVRVLLILAGFAVLMLVVLGTLKTGLLKQEFFPQVDEGAVSVQIEAPPGTRLEATNDIAAAVESIAGDAGKYPEVDTITTVVGSYSASIVQGAGNRGGHYAEVTIKLIDKRKRDNSDVEIARVLGEELSGLAGATVKVSTVGRMGGQEAPIQLELTGADDGKLEQTAARVAAVLRPVRGLRDVDVSWRTGRPEVRARIDREKVADFGLSTAQIARALRQSIAGQTITEYREGRSEYDVRVRLRGLDRSSVGDVGSVLVGTHGGLPVQLRDVARVYRSAGPTKLERRNKQRMVAVTANLLGMVLSDAQGDVQKAIRADFGADAVETGKGRALAGGVPDLMLGNVRMHWGGETEMQQENMARMRFALMLAAVLVFMTMAGLFNSMRDPLVIMFTLPMALVGALLALALTANSVSIISMIGIIMLMGIVGKNAILMVDYTRTLRERGYARTDAVLEAGPTRMRPILMTTFATVGGMLPTALALTRGAEIRSPMAIAVIGGLLLSMVLTLLMVPIMYTAAEDVTDFFRRLWFWGVRGWSWADTKELCAK